MLKCYHSGNRTYGLRNTPEYNNAFTSSYNQFVISDNEYNSMNDSKSKLPRKWFLIFLFFLNSK